MRRAAGLVGRVPLGLALALVGGAILRLWYWRDLAAAPWYGVPLVDSISFEREARAFLEGGHPGAYFRPPLYPLFLAALRALFGAGPGPVVASQFLLGLGAVVPAYLLARRWFGRGAAVAGAAVAAAYPLRIFLEGEVLDASLFSFLLLWGLWALWSARATREPLRALLAGLLLGAAVITRPNLVIALPFAAAGICAAFRGGRPAGAGFWGAAAAGVALAVLPATAHNWRAERAFIPVAANGGVNLYLGNAPGASGLTPLPPGLRWEAAMQEPLRQGIRSLAGQQRWWSERAWGALRADPEAWARLLARKTLLFFNAAEPSNNKALGHFTAVSAPVRRYRFWYGALVCLAVAGCLAPWLGGRAGAGSAERGGAVFVVTFTAGFALSVALFFVAERYRAPLVLVLAGPAAHGAASVGGAAFRGERRRALALAASTALAAAVVVPDRFDAGRERINADFQMGQVFLMRGEPARALEPLERARRADPTDPDVLNSLGAARFGLGDLGRAEEAYRAALALGDFSEVWFNLGVVLERGGPGRLSDAARAYRRALAANPLEERAQANLRHLAESAAAP